MSGVEAQANIVHTLFSGRALRSRWLGGSGACDMLPRMAGPTVEELRGMAALAGFAWSDEELRALAPLVERQVASVEKLTALPLQGVEPGLPFEAA